MAGKFLVFYSDQDGAPADLWRHVSIELNPRRNHTYNDRKLKIETSFRLKDGIPYVHQITPASGRIQETKSEEGHSQCSYRVRGRTVSDASLCRSWSISPQQLPEVSYWKFVKDTNGTVQLRQGKPLKNLIDGSLQAPAEKDLLLSARGDLAGKILLVLQEILDKDLNSASSVNSDYRYGIRRLLVRLSAEASVVPSSLFLTGIECEDKDPIGMGGYADIFRATYKNKPVILKRLRVYLTTHNSAEYALFCREALVWRQLRHDHILPFLGVDRVTFNSLLCMVAPWLYHGDIMYCMKTLEEQGEVIPFHRWMLEIAKGLKYLHDERVVHGDLRGPNILIDENLRVRLADFGLSRFGDSTTATIGSFQGGATRWMAPELFDGAPSAYSSDVYAFGCVCFEIYTQRRPFTDLSEAQVIVQLLRDQRPKRTSMKSGKPIPEEVWSLIERCWASVTGDRPDMSNVVSELSSWPQPEKTLAVEPMQFETLTQPIAFAGSAGKDADLDVINLIRSACSSSLIREVVLSVRGALADRFLCAIQQMVEEYSDNEPRPSFFHPLQILLYRLASASRLYPSSLFLHGLRLAKREPVVGGYFADIFRANYDGQEVALKRLRVSQSPNEKDFFTAFCREALVWKQLRHPNIPPLIGIDNELFPSRVCLVSRWVKRGSIYHYYVREPKGRSYHERVRLFERWITEIAYAVAYMHGERIIHADLRAGNVMVDDEQHALLTHFNLSFFVDDLESNISDGSAYVAFSRYMAPELLSATISRPNYATDVYAFGCLCVELFTGQRPFPGARNDVEAISRVLSGERPARPTLETGTPMSDGIWSTIQKCWESPTERPTMAEVADSLSKLTKTTPLRWGL